MEQLVMDKCTGSSRLGQTAAVKVFRGVPEELFKNEASLLAGMQKPFIVFMVSWLCKQKTRTACS
eukprot:c31599_g1_i1 orf=100-294(-)